MTRAERQSAQRPAYVTGVALISFLVVATFLVAFARFSVTQFDLERDATLASCGEQAVLSARDWCVQHADALAVDDRRTLPIADLLPPMTEGELTLERVMSDAGRTEIECQVRIRRGKATYWRAVRWPVAEPETPHTEKILSAPPPSPPTPAN